MARRFLLADLVERSCRRAGLVVLVGLLLAVLGGLYAWRHLGVSTDTDLLFAPSLPWRQRQMAYEKAFPQSKGVLVAVIQSAIPEEADATAAALAAALAADHDHFAQVWRPDASPYFDREGLLFLDPKTLGSLLDRTIDAQPFLGQLAADPSARGLFSALSLLAVGVQRGQADLAPFNSALVAFDNTLRQSAAGAPAPLSWERLLSGSLADLGGPYRFVVMKPKLDFGALQPGGAATAVLRATAARLEFVAGGTTQVRVTGDAALADEEFATAATGMLEGTIGSIVLIAFWLLLAVRSWRLIVPILATLVLGLVLTVTFATVAVGTLNLISVAFAILFVGIAVDFAIQFSVRYRDARREHPAPADAMTATARSVGGQIAVAAAATAAGFLAFVPTSFSGVAELGLIAGVGMVIAFLCTLFFLPAALTLCRPRGEAGEIGFRWGGAVEAGLLRLRVPVLAAFVALGVAGAVLLPRLTFDSDPLHTKDPNTEAMRTLADLIDNPLTDPYSADILAPSTAQAVALGDRLRPLSLVSSVRTIMSFVPTDQTAKLAMIGDAAGVLQATLAPREAATPVTPGDLRLAIRGVLSQFETALPKLAADSPAVAIAADLRGLATAPDATLMTMNTALTRFLPAQIDRLRLALSARPVTVADVPPGIARDWVLPDGRSRVQVLAKPGGTDSERLTAFVHQVQEVAPEAGGTAVVIAATSATIVGAFRSAAIGAVVAIAIILFVALRRPLLVGLVMAPLLLSAMMTVVVALALHMQLNFANIIALPLLLGVGVSFNIYFVMNWRDGARTFLGTATARAIVFSAFTTATAFGSLALSHHPGSASMGDLLLLSLGCTLVASLIFMPTLLGRLRPESLK